MKHAAFFTGIILSASLSGPDASAEKTILFSGYEWKVKHGKAMGPGPNAWDENNVWVDEQGRLHLKISQQNGKWHCAELISKERFGFGRYQWQLVGRPDKFDPQIVLGLFPYTIPEVGPDGTNEIDIEFARWGKAEWPIGNFTVWSAVKEAKQKTHSFDFKLDGDYTTNRFNWSAQGVEFWMLGGHRDDNQNIVSHWNYRPEEPKQSIPQNALPLHMNFWLFKGQPPQNGQGAEIILSKFSFTPEKQALPPEN
ncbi:MAG TPA: glycoside hydrolase family 16 protein [Abditibacteriaceae bacterium]|jgi:hypothetical protein